MWVVLFPLPIHIAVARNRVQDEEQHKCEEEDLVRDVERCEIVEHLHAA
jgi:hypothetical protein